MINRIAHKELDAFVKRLSLSGAARTFNWRGKIGRGLGLSPRKFS